MIRLSLPTRTYLRHHRAIVLLGLLLSVVGGWLSSHLTIESDLAELLPDSFESVQALERMQEKTGGLGQLRIVLSSDDFEAMRRFAEDLAPHLLASEHVSDVEYRNDATFYEEHALLYLSLADLDSLKEAVEETIEAEKQRLNPLMVDDLFGGPEEEASDRLAEWEERYESERPKPYYTNADSTVLVVLALAAESSSDFASNREMVEEVRAIVSSLDPKSYAPDMTVDYGGNIQNRLDEYQTVLRDIRGTALYGVGGVFLLLLIYFRGLAGPLLISVSLLASLSWTFGLTYLVLEQLNTITGFLFVVLFGLGVDFGIHAYARYSESRAAGLEVEPSIRLMVRNTGAALGTTAATTSAAFFSLTFMDFKGFSDLGFIAGVGILFAFGAMVVLLPALLVLVERLGWIRLRKRPESSLDFEPRPFRHARPILLGSALLTVLAAWSFTRVEFQYDFTDLRVMTEQRERVAEKTRGVFSRSESPALVMTERPEEVDEVVAAVRERKRRDTLSPTVGSVRSIFSLVPERQEEKLERIREIRELVEEEAEGVVSGEEAERIDRLQRYLSVEETFGWEDVPRNDRRQFVTRDGEVGNFVFIYPDVPLRDGRNAIEFRNDVGTITTETGKTYHAASPNIIMAEMLTIMIQEGRVAVGLTLAVVFLIVLGDLRRVGAALLVVSPLVIGLTWMGGAMTALGMKLNLFNIVVLPSVIGIGVDNGVHIYHRWREEGPGSLHYVLRHTGRAVLMTTLTTMVGYSGLVLASHPGLVSIGELAVLGIGVTFLAAVIVLPALIERFGRPRKAAG